MATEDQLILGPMETSSQVEYVEPRPISGKRPGLMIAALIGLGGGAVLVLAALGSLKGSVKGGKVSASVGLIGIASTCGHGEETEETTCAEEGSLIREQGRAVAYMSQVGCTGWLVKSETHNTGALMLTTGHCADRMEETFIFDYVKRCGGGKFPSKDKKCKGSRKIAKVTEDEEAFYELEKPCSITHTRTPIRLDVGSPDVGEGVYIIGHPQRRPQQLSHEEVHDKGTHCTLTRVGKVGSRRRINARYHCDTQGGNSGSPVFSARTGFAFAIHKWGGCNRHGIGGGNGGTLLTQNSIKDSLRKLYIPFVDRGETNIMYQSNWRKSSSCVASDLVVDNLNLQQCKDNCLNSLSCTAIAHHSNKCYITAVKGSAPKACQHGSQYFTLESRSLYRGPPDGTKPSPCTTDGSEGVGPGHKCVFPFKYKGKTYNKCTTSDHDTFWCATKVDSDGNYDGKWGRCGCCTTETGACKFPFKYQGNEYHSCTSVDHHSKWCYTNEKKGQWGHCTCG